MAIVVPCTNPAMSANSMPRAASASSTPRHWLPGVDGTLAGSSVLVSGS